MHSLLNTYSIIILPPNNIIEKVSKIKLALQQEIGTFNSNNTPAHITFCTFKAHPDRLDIWEKHTKLFLQSQQSHLLTFNRIENFSNGAFVILPDENSFTILQSAMKQFFQNRPKGKSNLSSRAHISVARNLSKNQQNIAKTIIDDINFSFQFQELTLQQQNRDTNQFEPILQFQVNKQAFNI